MLFPSLFVALGLASTVVVQARSNLSAETEIDPKSWTTYGPNKIDYKLTTDGPEPITYDVYLTTIVTTDHGSVQSYTHLQAANQTAVSGEAMQVQVWPGTAANATQQLFMNNQYSVRFVGHVQNTTAEGGHDMETETHIFNLTDPLSPSASATAKAGGSSSVVSFSSVGPLVAVVGFLVAGGVSIF